MPTYAPNRLPNSTDEACVGRIRGKLIGVKRNLENAREPSVEINLKDINSLLKRILHPQSHDDTSKPLYKKELQEAIEIIREIIKDKCRHFNAWLNKIQKLRKISK